MGSSISSFDKLLEDTNFTLESLEPAENLVRVTPTRFESTERLV
jgi:hypothetical protein